MSIQRSREAIAVNSLPRQGRVGSVDVLRGLVMVLMALDHTRDFLTNSTINPLDPARTSLALFASRWITHLCAPAFVFLAGTSIYLQSRRKSKAELTRFLLLRGAWLCLLELTAVHVVFLFHWQWDKQFLEVIWALGLSMMCMAALQWLPPRWLAALSLVLIAGHNALDAVPPSRFGSFAWVWNVLHVPGLAGASLQSRPLVFVAYPLLPWVAVMALGYLFGRVLADAVTGDDASSRRQRSLFRWGGGLGVAFVVLRLLNLYGDPQPWTHQAAAWRTLLSFLNVTKYPPSLLFLVAVFAVLALLMACILRAESRNRAASLRAVLTIYGSVPLFYFLVHLALIHLITLTLAAIAGGDWHWWFKEIPDGGILTGRPPGFGYSLPVVWAIWIGVVTALYPLCRWYARIRRSGRYPWLSYL